MNITPELIGLLNDDISRYLSLRISSIVQFRMSYREQTTKFLKPAILVHG